VRVTDISHLLGVRKPTVTAAINRLVADGLVRHERYGNVELTREGVRIARDVLRRERILFKFLSEVLGIRRQTAQEDACKLEHSLSPGSVRRLSKFVDFVMTCPQGKPLWQKGFSYYAKHGERDPAMVARCLVEEC
jgi:DtxR family Mn-dependent transcriptional regulator